MPEDEAACVFASLQMASKDDALLPTLPRNVSQWGVQWGFAQLSFARGGSARFTAGFNKRFTNPIQSNPLFALRSRHLLRDFVSVALRAARADIFCFNVCC